ncbi:hypothetical protein TK5_11450 [Sideroxyarcus sp. TK5]
MTPRVMGDIKLHLVGAITLHYAEKSIMSYDFSYSVRRDIGGLLK